MWWLPVFVLVLIVVAVVFGVRAISHRRRV
jgi:hypothetical protein